MLNLEPRTGAPSEEDQEKLLCDTSKPNSVGGKKISLKEIVRQLDWISEGLNVHHVPVYDSLTRGAGSDLLKTLSTTIKQDYPGEVFESNSQRRMEEYLSEKPNRDSVQSDKLNIPKGD